MNIPIRLVRAKTVRELEAMADASEAADIAADQWYDLYKTTAAQADDAYDRVAVLKRERDAARQELTALRAVREDLARELGKAREQRHAARNERDVIEGESESLRKIVGEVARTLVSAADPTTAVLAAARALLIHAPELRLTDDDRVMTALRDLAQPWVCVLLRYGVPRGAYYSTWAAEQAAELDGADPDGWTTRTVTDVAATAWVGQWVPVDPATPWLALGDLDEIWVLIQPSGEPHSAHTTKGGAHSAAREAGFEVRDLVRVPVHTAPASGRR